MNSMFKYLTCILAFLIYSTNAFSQYTMTNGMIEDCSGSFTDSGGGGNYGINENFTFTICAAVGSTDTHTGLVFSPIAGNISAGDVLCIYDGDDITAPLIVCSDNIAPVEAGAGFLAQASAVNPSGCLTITFVSDGVVGNDVGWDATLVCNQQCQNIKAIIANSTPSIMPVDTGYLDLCPGEILFLEGEGEYPQNNFIYPQSDNTSTFEWDFGDGTMGFGPNVQHIYNEPGGYIIQLTITDENGCTNTNFITQRVRVSGPPTFNIDPDINNVVCTNDTIAIYTAVNDAADISIQPGSYGFQAGGSVADSICIPDNDGTIYESTLGLGSFSPGQTLNDVNDIIGICIDIEHSYIGDLEIKLICPDGTVVVLQDYGSGGGGTYLGTPFDNEATACQGGPIGEGGTYCWTPNATNGTWGNYNGPTPNGSLPEGDYEPSESLNAFVGCPLNGEWILTIEDYLGIDDGVIFSWELVLNEDIFPNLEVFDLAIVDANWVSDPSIIVNTPDSMIAVPTNPGAINYIFETTDNFGCVYDTTILVNVLPQTDPTCYTCSGNLMPLTDVTICDDGENTQLITSLENVDLTTTTFQDTPNAPFNNTNTPPSNPLLSTIAVSGLPYNFIDISSIESICMNLLHPSDIDVVATLVAPNGTSVQLTSGGATVFGQNYTETCFSLDAATAITTGAPPYTGDWLPDGDLTTLVGSQANGNWTLQVADQYPGFEGGLLINWSMTFNLANNLIWEWTPAAGLSCTDCEDPIAQPTVTTTYDVTATDQYDCVFTESVTVTVIDCNIPCNLVASLDGTTDASCSGAADGTVTISATGQIGILTYELDGGTVVQVDNGVFTGLTDGPHQVILTDANNCIETIDFTISTPNPMTVVLTPTNISCNGQNDGIITAVASGGDSNYSYEWDNSLITATINNLAANTYTVTVTDGNGCTVSVSEIITESDAILLTTTESPVACFGGNDGSSTVGATGGVGSFTYLWSDVQTTATAVDLVAGTYTVTVTDNANCTTTIEAIITEPLAPLGITSISQTAVSCAGENGGEATVVATGGTGLYAYEWIPSGGFADIATGLTPGTYTVIISDENVCTTTATVDIIESNPIVVTTSGTNLLCFEDNSGTVTAVANGGSAAFTYLWSDNNAQINATAIGLNAGTYTVTATDTNNCTATNTVTIISPTAITIQLTPTNISCNGFNDGEITALASGGDGSYSYLWSNALATATISNLNAMTYTVIATDGMGCTASAEVMLNESTAMSLTISGTDISCSGGNDGTTNVIATGGATTYNYLWNDPSNQTTATATGLTAGIYTVTVTDANLCTIENSITITEPAGLSIASISQTTVGCFASNAGEATVITSGGTGTVTYNWSPSGGNSNIATGLAPGTYAVVITDENLCDITANVDIIENDPLLVDIEGTDVLCGEGNDGTATVTPLGTSGPYTYLWSDPSTQTGATANNLTVGTYTVTCTDVYNCTATVSVTLTEPEGFTVYPVVADVSCFGGSDGDAGVFHTGGVYPYEFNWSTGDYAISTNTNFAQWDLDPNGCIIYNTLSTTPVTSFLDTICYIATDGVNTINAYVITSIVATGSCAANAADTDNDGVCDANDPDINDPCIPNSFDMNENGVCDFLEPNVVSTTYLETEVSTSNNTACINLPATFDAANTTYAFCDNSDGNFTRNVTAGTYTVTVTDAKGCTYSAEIVVSEPPILDSTVSGTNVNCFGGADGETNVTVAGGTPPYSYLWSDATAQTTDTATGLIAGTYSVTVTDANMCTMESSINIVQPSAALQITSIAQTFIGCADSNEGEAQVIATGGTPPYIYDWISGDSANNIANLATGTYTVIITDANGCTIDGTVDIVEYAPMAVTATSIDATCFDGSNGFAEVTLISGGAGTGNLSDYTYLWSANNQTTSFTNNLSVGEHFITVTDVVGCTAIDTITISSPTEVISSTEIGNVSCSNTAEGWAKVTADGGIAPYTYQWDFAAGLATVDSIFGLAPGGYGVTVTDANGCTSVSYAFINPILAMSIAFDVVNNNCYADLDGIITANVTGGDAPYIYIWSTGNTTTVNSVDSLYTGYHSVTVTDANGCTANSGTLVFGSPELTIDVDVMDVNCFGDRNGSIVITGAGGDLPYTYSFNGLDFGDSNYEGGLFPGNYDIAIQDANGCITNLNSVLVDEPLELEAIIYPSANIINVDLGDSIQLNSELLNGIGGITYQWEALYNDSTLVGCNNCPSPIIYTLENDRYLLTATDANGCVDTADVSINVPRDRDIFVPSGFTPNGDNINDVLMAHGTSGTWVRSFRVFDRLGELVFRKDGFQINSTETDVVWDGTFKGKNMN
jgi:gliding motility-associated-like protein